MNLQSTDIHADFAAPLEGWSIDDQVARARRRNLIDLCEATYAEPPSFELTAALHEMTRLVSEYPSTKGIRDLREVVAVRREASDRVPVDPDTEVVVTQGATGALAAVLTACVRPGDEVLTFTPGYPLPHSLVAAVGGTVRYAALVPPAGPSDHWTFDASLLRRVFSKRTRCVVMTSPHNPTGKCYTEAEIALLVDMCAAQDALLIADAVYEDFIYTPAHLVSARALAPESVVVVGSASKSLRAPGLRVGWLVAPRSIAATAARVVDDMSAGICLPAQRAAAVALSCLSSTYWTEQRTRALLKCDRMIRLLEMAGLQCFRPEGGLTLVGCSSAGGSDYELTRGLERLGLAVVPMSTFDAVATGRSPMVRIAFGRPDDTIDHVEAKLAGTSSETLAIQRV